MIASIDYLRRFRPIEQPMLSISFYLVAIGAFGDFAAAILGHYVSPFTVMIHAGVVAYALTAMDMGLFAAEAVGMVKRRESGTGGQVRTLTIKEEK